MHQGQTGDDDVREVRIEGFGLYVVGGLVVAALVGAFYLGRWVERAASPGGGRDAIADLGGPSGGGLVDSEPADVDESATVFDRVGGEQAAEPAREVDSSGPDPDPNTGRGPDAAAAAAAAARERPAPVSEGGYFVQVIALHDQAGAAKVVDSLQDKGFPVRLDTSRTGQTTVYKVRVGGYPTRAKADEIAERLRGDGFPGAWVTR